MNKLSSDEFLDILNERIATINVVLGSKAKEYAFKGDRLYNFNQAAVINSTTPAKALWGMATKHLVSIQDLINNRLENTEKNVNEKIGDMINYLILLEGILSTTRQEIIEED